MKNNRVYVVTRIAGGMHLQFVRYCKNGKYIYTNNPFRATLFTQNEARVESENWNGCVHPSSSVRFSFIHLRTVKP